MLSNFHTHSTFCDGKNTPEEVVKVALEKGFSALGFSGHGYTPYDLCCCMKDMGGYRAEILRLKEQYKDKIQIYLGCEEDALALVERSDFDYIIGSSHYIFNKGKCYSIDSSPDWFKRCLESFDNDKTALANHYYSQFCDYLKKRKPDIVGHFDLITKYNEIGACDYLENSEYKKIARDALSSILSIDPLIEVNTGAISRGYRTTPYPSEDLLNLLFKSGARLILSSDSHAADTIDFCFEETKRYLYDIGFRSLYTILDGRVEKYDIKP